MTNAPYFYMLCYRHPPLNFDSQEMGTLLCKEVNPALHYNMGNTNCQVYPDTTSSISIFYFLLLLSVSEPEQRNTRRHAFFFFTRQLEQEGWWRQEHRAPLGSVPWSTASRSSRTRGWFHTLHGTFPRTGSNTRPYFFCQTRKGQRFFFFFLVSSLKGKRDSARSTFRYCICVTGVTYFADKTPRILASAVSSPMTALRNWTSSSLTKWRTVAR